MVDQIHEWELAHIPYLAVHYVMPAMLIIGVLSRLGVRVCVWCGYVALLRRLGLVSGDKVC